MVATEISMAISSIQAAFKIVKLISESSKDAVIKENTIKLQDTILSIQSSFSVLNERYLILLSDHNNLKDKMRQINEWKITESHYNLTKSESGVYFYIPNKTHPNPKPTHYLCTNCYDKRKKSILQVDRRYSVTQYGYVCPECGMKIRFNPVEF